MARNGFPLLPRPEPQRHGRSEWLDCGRGQHGAIQLGTTNFQVGDPEWIGVLARPDQPYGPNNPFIARYAFIALPVGNSLDLNAIHNQALVAGGKTKNRGVESHRPGLLFPQSGRRLVGNQSRRVPHGLEYQRMGSESPIHIITSSHCRQSWATIPTAVAVLKMPLRCSPTVTRAITKRCPACNMLFGLAGATAFPTTTLTVTPTGR